MIPIGYDNGYANGKLCVDGKTAVVQNAVSRPKDIGLAGTGLKSAGRDTDTVSFDTHTFSVGTGAWYKGNVITSMDYSALVSQERLAVMYACISKVAEPELFTEPVVLGVGLPVPLMVDKSMGELVVGSLRTLKREHAFSVNDKKYAFTIASIKKYAQPVGAYLNWALDDNLKQRVGVRDSEVAVVDIGLNTLDLYALRNGEVVDTYVGGDEVGVKRLLEMMDGTRDLAELDSMLRSGKIVPSKDQIDEWIAEIIACIKNTMPRLSRFDVVIPVGGGTVVAGEKLRDALITRGAKVVWSEDPIVENVKGIWKATKRYS
jgi:hypothetical protein